MSDWRKITMKAYLGVKYFEQERKSLEAQGWKFIGYADPKTVILEKELKKAA